ncbi:MAG: thiamine pyrophosphate-dependent enzyme, partial [Rhodothermales bacterium]|nr:thiamine pyrophosphate-dependent enzyme [Rhodothermales bacterium]
GSSMPVRDVDSFSAPSAGLNAFGNRGASGIDGTLATAFGIAAGRSAPVTVHLGDLALLHDLNSLALVRSSEIQIVIVVVNNDGGGIFSFLPIADFHDEFEDYFGTPHGLGFEAAARMFGLRYEAVNEAAAFADSYRAICDSGASGLIEVRTERTENRQLHEDLVEAVCRLVDDRLSRQPSIPNRV